MAQRTASTTLNQHSVARTFHHATVMHGNGRIDQIASKRPQPRQRAILVGASKLAVSDNIRRQDRCELPGLGHDGPSATARLAR
jgi:hypothetical protein